MSGRTVCGRPSSPAAGSHRRAAHQGASPIARRIAARVRSSAAASPSSRPATPPPEARLCSSKATSAGSRSGGQVAGRARAGAPRPRARRASGGRPPRRRRAAAPGRASYSTDAVVTKQPPGKTPSRRWLDPRVDDRLEPRRAPGADRSAGTPDRVGEPLDGGGEHRALHRLLVAEAPDQAALAHRELAGEPPDRDALEPLDGGEVDGRLDGGGPAVGDVGGGSARHVADYTERTIVLYNSRLGNRREDGRCD